MTANKYTIQFFAVSNNQGGLYIFYRLFVVIMYIIPINSPIHCLTSFQHLTTWYLHNFLFDYQFGVVGARMDLTGRPRI